jgi:integrase
VSDRLTKRIVDRTPYPQRGQTFVWDSALKGFGLRVTPTRKTYIVQARVAGKTVRVTVGSHGPLTPEQARHEAHKRLGEMAKGVNLNRERRIEKVKAVTLAQAYADYLKARKLTANTVKDYSKAMRRGFADWAEAPITRLSRVMVERRFAELSLHSPAQANQMFRFLRALLNFAMAKYLDADGNPTLPSNPCDQLSALKLWHRIERRTTYLQAHQLRVWMQALEHAPEDGEHRKTVKDFCFFVLLTGCREQEAGKLKRADVDLEARTVTFPDTKNHRDHTLPVGEWLAGLLERRLRSHDSSYVFPAANQHGHVRYHRKSILSIVSTSGVPFTLHDLRRTFSSIVNHGLGRVFSPYTLKRLLNHSSTDVTAGYIQHGVEDLREPMELVERYVLRQACGAKVIPLARDGG